MLMRLLGAFAPKTELGTMVTALTKNIKYMHLDQLYLGYRMGHSHRTLADRNYKAKGGRAYKPFDDAIAFIGQEYGLK